MQEWGDEERTKPFVDLSGVMPGSKVTQITEIRNIGLSDAWVRVKAIKAITLSGEGTPDTDLLELDYNTTDWTQSSDGYFYYNEALKPGHITKPLFTTVTFNVTMDNTYQNSTINVDIAAQAVQTANNGDNVMAANGWPAP